MFQLKYLFFFFMYTITFLSVTTGSLTSDIVNDKNLYLATNKVWEFSGMLPANQSIKLIFTMEEDVVFASVQVHSFINNVTVTYDNNNKESGSNNGIILIPVDNRIGFDVLNINKIPTEVLIFVTGFDEHYPIPGACLSFNNKASLDVQMSSNTIKVTAQPALNLKITNRTCSTNYVNYKLFYMYTPEKDFSQVSYFEGIKSMIYSEYTGKQVGQLYNFNLNNDGQMSFSFAKYPGTGLLFNLVAESGNRSSAYAVAHTFGCNITSSKDTCFYLVSTRYRVGIIILCVFGLVVCCCSYQWKSFEFAVMSFLLLFIVTYTSFYNFFPLDELVLVSLLSGSVLSSVFVIASLYLRCYHLHRIATYSVFGVHSTATILFFFKVGTLEVFKNADVYWATFAAIAATVVVLLDLNRSSSHYITSSVVGSFLTVVTLDYFAGSSLKFIVLDNIRRISQDGFIEAHCDPPFQIPDTILAVSWAVGSVLSSIYQWYNGRLRSSGIPGRRSNDADPAVNVSSFDETSPLLRANSIQDS